MVPGTFISSVTQRVLLYANPTFPDLLGAQVGGEVTLT